MIIRNVLLLILMLYAPFSLHAQSNQFAADVLKIINKQAYFLTFPIIPIAYTHLQKHSDGTNGFAHFIISMATWYLSGHLLKVTSQAIMDEYHIDPMQD